MGQSVTGPETIVWGFYWLRTALSELYGRTLYAGYCQGLILLEKFRQRRRRTHGIAPDEVRFEFILDRPLDRLLLMTLNTLSKLGSLLSGVVEIRQLHGELAIATKDIVFIGFKRIEGSNLFWVRPLGEKRHTGLQNMIWTDRTARIGRFSIVGSELAEHGKVPKVIGIWVSGEYAGRQFELDPPRSVENVSEYYQDNIRPDFGFRQTAISLLIVQVLALVGATHILGIVRAFWNWIRNLHF